MASAEDAATGLGALGFASPFEIGETVQVAVEVDLRGARAGAAARAVLLAVTGRYRTALVAVNVALRFGDFFAVIASSVGLAEFLCGAVAFSMATGKAIEELGVAGRYALGAAGIDAHRLGAGRAATGTRGLKLQRSAVCRAAPLDLYLAVDACR